MSQPLTPQQKKQVIDLHYCGNTNQDISESLGISIGSVSNILKAYQKSIDSQDYHATISISKNWKNHNLTPNDAHTALELESVLKKHNLSLDSLPQISQLLEKITSQNIPFTQFLDTSTQLVEITDASDVPLFEIPQKYHSLQDKCESSQKQLTQINAQIKTQENSLQDIVKSKGTTTKKLESFCSVTDSLHLMGVDVNDYESLQNILKSAKAENYDITKVITHMNQEDLANSRISELNQKQQNLNDIIASQDIQINSKELQIKNLDDTHDKLVSQHKNIQNSIRAIKRLQKSGVTLSDIESWDKLLHDIDVSKITKSIDLIKSLDDKKQILNSEINSLRGVISGYNGDITQLKLNIAKLESAQKTLLQLDKKLKEIMSSAISHSLISTGNSFRENGNNFKNSVSTSIVSIEELVLSFSKQADALLQLNEKISSHTVILSQAEQFSALYKVRKGLPVPTVEVLLIFSGIIHDLINWCIREKISNTAFAKSLCYIDEKIKLLFHPSGAA